jgi:threonine/homoserine/homoserine lactone efflux protein
MDGATAGMFFGGLFAVMALPGPSLLYVMSHTLEAGRAAGLVAVLGLEVALVLHVVVATTGLGAVLEASPVALTVLRHVGAGYLVWLAVWQLRDVRPAAVPVGAGSADVAVRAERGRAFRQACVVDLLNPGTALFLVAFLPRFVDSGAGSTGGQLLVLGVLVVVVAAACDASWVLATARLSRGDARLRRAAGRHAVGVRRSIGVVYLVLAGMVLVA